MSTRAAIGMLMPDWTIKAIYLHQDGCPFESGAGGVLAQHYTTTERVEMLLDLGDLSSLGAKIFPDAKTPHSRANPQPDVTVAYHRDRGEDYNPPVVSATFTNTKRKVRRFSALNFCISSWMTNGSYAICMILHASGRNWKTSFKDRRPIIKSPSKNNSPKPNQTKLK